MEPSVGNLYLRKSIKGHKHGRCYKHISDSVEVFMLAKKNPTVGAPG